MPARTVDQLDTPAFLIERRIAEANSRRMKTRADELGVVLRPHVKTHKTVQGARLQHGGRTGPIAVSTVKEAEFFSEAGFDDITYALPLAPDKLPRLLQVQQKVRRLNLLVDNRQTVGAVEEFARGNDTRFRLLLKVDCGYHRAGVDPESGAALDLARRIQDSDRVRFAGLLTHAGHAYSATSGQQLLEAAAQERDRVAALEGRLEEEGIFCETVSVGSTPTMAHVADLAGVTEIRPGNYFLFDKFQADLGSCRLEDCAASVLTQVVGVYPERRQVVIDAGALALSKDTGATHLGGKTVFGAVVGRPELAVVSLSQEHGVLTSSRPLDPESLHIGTRLRIIPNHSCLAAALFPSYFLVSDQQVTEEWIPCRGW